MAAKNKNVKKRRFSERVLGVFPLLLLSVPPSLPPLLLSRPSSSVPLASEALSGRARTSPSFLPPSLDRSVWKRRRPATPRRQAARGQERAFFGLCLPTPPPPLSPLPAPSRLPRVKKKTIITKRRFSVPPAPLSPFPLWTSARSRDRRKKREKNSSF